MADAVYEKAAVGGRPGAGSTSHSLGAADSFGGGLLESAAGPVVRPLRPGGLSGACQGALLCLCDEFLVLVAPQHAGHGCLEEFVGGWCEFVGDGAGPDAGFFGAVYEPVAFEASQGAMQDAVVDVTFSSCPGVDCRRGTDGLK